MLCRWSVNSSGKQAFMGFKSAILHAFMKQKMTNGSIVGAIWIQLVVASRKKWVDLWMESSTLLWCLFGMPFISGDERNIVSGAPLGTRILLCFHVNSPLMIDNVEIGPWRDRHQFNGNCIVFSRGNLHRRSNNRKKWVCAVQHSMHYVDVVVDMKRNCVAFFLSCTVFQRRFISCLACFWSCAVAWFNIPAAKMALKAVLYLYFLPPPLSTLLSYF